MSGLIFLLVRTINSNISHLLSRQENISLTAVQIMEAGHVLTVTDYLHRNRFPSLHTGNHSTASHIAFLSVKLHPIWTSTEPTMESEQAIMVFTYKKWAALESITCLRPPLMWGSQGLLLPWILTSTRSSRRCSSSSTL